MKKTISLILTAVLIFAFAVFALGSGSKDSTTVEKNAKTEQSGSSQEENKRVEINVGETLNANELKITYDSAEKWSSSNEFIQPGDGKQFIRLHFSIENNTGSDQYIGLGDFECYADGSKCESSYFGDDMLSFDSLSSGRKIAGYVYYEVPVNASEIEIEYETSFWTDKKAYFIVNL
ncbi:MAG: DUF4352 domain-containing protein [Clostridia bacterium]|nr:DUF4352 domain-containing protein [Clostridia bacterium]